MTFEKFLEHHAHHLKASASHHMARAEEYDKSSKSNGVIAGEHHTNQVLAQEFRDKSLSDAASAQHHRSRAKHYIDQHEKLAPASDATLVNEHSDAADDLRSAAHDSFAKRMGWIEA